MKGLVDRSMGEGAFGLTVGLDFAPGNAAKTPNGKGAAEDDAQPGTRASGGPSRLPAFTGMGPQVPIGSQDVHGSDGPSAADAASATNGAAAGGRGPGDAADSQVTVPPAGPEQRLPIFDSLESDWFRRSGKTLTSTPRNQGGQGGQAAQAAQAAQAGQAAPSAEQSSWTSPADEGWRAAEVVAAPTAGETTQAGLPRRVPRANLVPGSVGAGSGSAPGRPGSHDTETEAPARSADAARSRMASFQRGVREGRAAAPQIEEP